MIRPIDSLVAVVPEMESSGLLGNNFLIPCDSSNNMLLPEIRDLDCAHLSDPVPTGDTASAPEGGISIDHYSPRLTLLPLAVLVRCPCQLGQ